MMEYITRFDFVVLDFIQAQLRCSFLDAVMPIVSMLGNGGAVWLFFAAVMLLKKTYRRRGCVLLIGLAVGFIVGNLLLKPIVARPRPSWVNLQFSLLIDNPSDYSFPSGHTLSSFIAAVFISMDNRKLSCVVIPLACLMAFSRLYLYVHYPSDVLAAVALAFVIAVSVHRLCCRKNKDNDEALFS